MRRIHLTAIVCSLFLIGTSLLAQAPATSAPALLTAADQELTADGVTLRYRDVGTGAPIVLIHGYTATLESMAGIARALPQEYRMIALDVRGFGRSTKFSDAASFGQLMVDDVVRLMDHLKVARAHVIGHSMGALLAANVAARYGNRVSTAALVAGPFYEDDAAFARESARWTADLESGKGLNNFMLWLFPGWKPEMAGMMNAQVMKANDLGSLTAVMKSLPKLSINRLSSNGDKILLVAGTGDPLFPLSVNFAKNTRGARIVEIPGADHINVIVNPAAVTAMRELLQR